MYVPRVGVQEELIKVCPFLSHLMLYMDVTCLGTYSTIQVWDEACDIFVMWSSFFGAEDSESNLYKYGERPLKIESIGMPSF